MAIKIIHTADWHLGHQLHGFDRAHEHQAFLHWLIKLIAAEQADALLVAGDLFDTANPASSTWKMLYHFLAQLSKAMPKLDIIILGGNHDSPSKLNAPHDLLKAFDLHMLGSVQRDNEGQLDINSLLVPIYDKTDEIAAWVIAMPFLRTSDLRTGDIDENQDKLITGVAQIYQQALEAAKEKQQKGQALVATGHLYMASTELSELSERRILGGNQHALPAGIFSQEIDYIALGHLHLAQCVAKQERIRYSGSPIPLSITERHYKHQVLAVEFENGKLSTIQPHFVPRTVDLLRMPEKAQPIKETLAILQQWQPEQCEEKYQPLLEVPVLLDAPEPMLRDKILQVLEGKAVRLARIATHYHEKKQSVIETRTLEEVTPNQVFSYHWQAKYADEPPKSILDAFAKLQEELEQQQEDV